jgi:26S proteasome regulatory subunit N1
MAPKEEDAITIAVESTGGKDDGVTKKVDKEKPEEGVTDTLSDEDRELKERLETCVSTLINKDDETSVTIPIRLKALDVIVTELRTATSSMTSVPKPLKFLRPHFGVLKNLYSQIQNVTIINDNDMLELRARLADVLAVLAMTLGKPECAEFLFYCFGFFVDATDEFFSSR